MNHAILTGHCTDREGLVAKMTLWVSRYRGNIVHLDQHVEEEAGRFFIRVEWDLSGFEIEDKKIADRFSAEIAEEVGLDFSVGFTKETPRIALFVSKESHCLWDILSRWTSGEWDVDISCIIGNHPEFEKVAKQFSIPFHCLPITKETKGEQEAKELALLEQYEVDLVVLARYMQVLSDSFIAAFAKPILNIHHSFLPAFAGARPYRKAYDRGVKLIGATAHYVTPDLDEGPIVEQDIARVSHRDTVQDMIRRGKDLEKVVLSRAIFLHLNRQVIVHDNRTVVFT